MSILTGRELDATRQPFIRQLLNPAWRRQAVNAAIQAIEDVFTSAQVQSALSNAIDNAITPATMTAAEKRLLVKWYLKNRFDRGN